MPVLKIKKCRLIVQQRCLWLWCLLSHFLQLNSGRCGQQHTWLPFLSHFQVCSWMIGCPPNSAESTNLYVRDKNTKHYTAQVLTTNKNFSSHIYPALVSKCFYTWDEPSQYILNSLLLLTVIYIYVQEVSHSADTTVRPFMYKIFGFIVGTAVGCSQRIMDTQNLSDETQSV